MRDWTKKYMLKGREVIETTDLLEWAEWLETSGYERQIGLDSGPDPVTREPGATITISTVFLGLDHGWYHDGPPILFETMVFGGEHDHFHWRYATYDEAEEGHRKVCERELGRLPILDAEYLEI